MKENLLGVVSFLPVYWRTRAAVFLSFHSHNIADNFQLFKFDRNAQKYYDYK